MGYMLEHIGEPAMYEQLAEECAELGQAALKMARVLRKENPTPVTEDEASAMVLEEAADVWNCMNEVGITTNDLIGMTWDPEHNLWEGKTEEGNPCWTVKLPPTQELIDKEKNEDRESFEKWMKELEAKEKKEETA